MSNSLVSVLMPVFNAEKYLEAALDSIVNQTYKNLEIVVVDDCSTDASLRMVELYAAKDPRIKVVRNTKNLKLISTLNVGLSYCTGEFIARMDADDVSELSRIEEQLRYFSRNPEVDILSCNMTKITESGKRKFSFSHLFSSSVACRFSHLFINPISNGPLMVRSSVFENVGYEDSIDAIHIEDYLWCSKAISLGYKVAVLRKALYRYRDNGGSVSNVYSDVQAANHIRLSRRLIMDELGIDVDAKCHEIAISKYSGAFDFCSYLKSAKLIDEVYLAFVHKFEPPQDCLLDIRRFIQVRKCRIAIDFVKRSGFFDRLRFSLYFIFIDRSWLVLFP